MIVLVGILALDRDLRSLLENTNEHENYAHCSHTPEIDCAATEVRHEAEPRDESSNKGHSCSSEIETVSCLSVKSDLLEEIGRVVGEAGTTENLTGENHTSDFRSSELCTLEAIKV